ncbi:uncharacterized protein LOC120517922 isoform X2 [Polypterus senegalus]|nr:uncharacterized protein LOC120517922 isoform X2 [Polypterus senegalus]XP_039596392.1 uncharacterized protein LOC120517922 isoform X2 [Polypterus senegalus]
MESTKVKKRKKIFKKCKSQQNSSNVIEQNTQIPDCSGEGDNEFDNSLFQYLRYSYENEKSRQRKHKKSKKNKHKVPMSKPKQTEKAELDHNKASNEHQPYKKTKKKNSSFDWCITPSVKFDNTTFEHISRKRQIRSFEDFENIICEQQKKHKLPHHSLSKKDHSDKETDQKNNNQVSPVCKINPNKTTAVFDRSDSCIDKYMLHSRNKIKLSRKGCTVHEDCCSYNKPLPCSTPEIRTKSFNTNDEKSLKETKSETEIIHEINEDMFNSQDLFITQKNFQPVIVSSGESDFALRVKRDHQRYMEREEPEKQSMASVLSTPMSPYIQRFKNCHHICNNEMKTHADKATQTDISIDLSSMTMSSKLCKYLSKAKCKEIPVDFSLPSRVRANIPNTDEFFSTKEMCRNFRASPSVSGPESQYTESDKISGLTSEGGNKTFSQSTYGGTQLKKSEEGKYKQMHLNKSYFFKVKNETECVDPNSPLRRLMMLPDKRVNNRKTT